MAVKIRLRRMGYKKNPIYRIIVADSRSPRDCLLYTSIDDFNASHEDIQVEVSFGKTYDNVVTAIATQDTPDLFDMYWQYASPLAARGALYDLTEFVENDAEFEKADFLERVWDLCTVDGKIYSIPNLASSCLLYTSTRGARYYGGKQA